MGRSGRSGLVSSFEIFYFVANDLSVKSLYCAMRKFLDATKTPTLSSQLRAIRANPSKATDMFSLYWNLGTIYFHETYVYQPAICCWPWDFYLNSPT